VTEGEQGVKPEAKAVLEADGLWLKAVQESSLEKIESHYHDEATWLLPGEATIFGKQAILDRWSRAFKVPGFSIRWKPFGAEVSESCDLGMTVGYWESSGASKTFSGKYVAVWKKKSNGKWCVFVDISN